MEKNLRHDPSVKESYDVPFFITGSDYTERAIVENKRDGFNFVYALSEVMGINVKELNSGYNFFDEHNDLQQVNNGEGEMIDYQTLNDDPIK
ncbi:hypothetical protein [Aliivibrio wodanis]|uniref:hypothetical protein n=1 Tax=Aliivibrio wodanis TaxID=80852 RepID=UPI00406CDCA6